jgi:curved DNA-binding protein CbpA
MSSQNNLEIKGKLSEHPLAELLLEISETNLSGSIRVENDGQKVIVYLNEGAVVFAVSNMREHRLPALVVRNGKVPREKLAAVPKFANDLEFSKALVKRQILTKAETDELFVRQIKEILQTVFAWKEGEWIFSSLARIRGDINFYVDLREILLQFARSLPPAAIVRRFKSLQESFRIKPNAPEIEFQPQEAFVLSRFEDAALRIEEVKSLSGLSDFETLHVIYTLWLTGLLWRQGWNTAFSARKIAEILSAKIVRKKGDLPKIGEDAEEIAAQVEIEEEESPPEVTEEEKAAEQKITLDEYLAHNEAAANHYETLGIALKVSASDIKKAYFNFAKQFHPDLFHRTVEPEMHRRIQNAFSKVAQAYDTLRSADSREAYDFKLRRELADIETDQAEEAAGEKVDMKGFARQASQFFEHGFTLLMEEYYEEALPYLARAAHLAQDNARYHAFYGKALSIEDKHKAEGEMQTAIKLDSENPIYRLILAEFFIENNLLKRAEGELKRLLAIAPDHIEAQRLLDSLTVK